MIFSSLVFTDCERAWMAAAIYISKMIGDYFVVNNIPVTLFKFGMQCGI